MSALEELVEPLSEEVFWKSLPDDPSSLALGDRPKGQHIGWCDVCEINYSNGSKHRAEAGHTDRMTRLIDTRNGALLRLAQIIGNAAMYEPLIRKLESETWKEEFRRKLLPTYDALADLLAQEEVPAPIQIDLGMIANKLFRERLGLVEMAAWKNIVLVEEGGKYCNPKDFLVVSRFLYSGWKEYKVNYRKHGSIETIARCVAPFLDRHELY